MGTWYNADGLEIKYGRSNEREKNQVKSVKSFGHTQELVINFDLDGVSGETLFDTDRDNDGTLDGFNTGSVAIPDQAYIESAEVYLSDEAGAGGTSIAVGTYQEDGTAIDDDGLVTAVNGAVANLTANTKVTGSGALIGSGVTQRSFVAVKAVGTFTAGKGSVIIKYTLPQTV